MTALRLEQELAEAKNKEAEDRDAIPLEPADSPWSRLELLVAQAIDAINGVSYVLQVVNSDGQRVEEPKPTPRPGVRLYKLATEHEINGDMLEMFDIYQRVLDGELSADSLEIESWEESANENH